MAYSREKIDMDALVKRLSAGHDRVRYDEGAALLSMGIHLYKPQGFEWLGEYYDLSAWNRLPYW